jgi:hypothetical protein
LKEEMFLPLCQWGLLVVRCWNSNITTGVNYSNLSLISNILDTLYVPQENYLLVDVDSVLALKKTALFVVKPEAVACKPIRNTLRFARLR